MISGIYKHIIMYKYLSVLYDCEILIHYLLISCFINKINNLWCFYTFLLIRPILIYYAPYAVKINIMLPFIFYPLIRYFHNLFYKFGVRRLASWTQKLRYKAFRLAAGGKKCAVAISHYHIRIFNFCVHLAPSCNL